MTEKEKHKMKELVSALKDAEKLLGNIFDCSSKHECCSNWYITRVSNIYMNRVKRLCLRIKDII